MTSMVFLTWSNRRHICYSHENSQCLSTNLKLGWVCVLTRTNAVIDISLRQSPFPSSAYRTKKGDSTCPETGCKSDSNDFTPNSNNPFHHPSFSLIKSISWREINPECHLPREGKAKRGRLTRKGVINLLNYKLFSLRVRDLPFLYIHIFLYPCTSRIYFHTPVPHGLSLCAYLTS